MEIERGPSFSGRIPRLQRGDLGSIPSGSISGSVKQNLYRNQGFNLRLGSIDFILAMQDEVPKNFTRNSLGPVWSNNHPRFSEKILIEI